jgi:hypothetical protein
MSPLNVESLNNVALNKHHNPHLIRLSAENKKFSIINDDITLIKHVHLLQLGLRPLGT